MTQQFDELNSSDKKWKRSIPYEKYFGEMELSDEEKEKRIELAKKIEIAFVYLFSLIELNEFEDKDDLYNTTYDMYLGVANDYMNATEGTLAYINSYVSSIVDEIIDTTLENTQETEDEEIDETDYAYYLSLDRAMFIAENEANAIANYKQLYDALKKGLTQKTWLTMKDKRVRHTHKKIDEHTIPILSTFDVGGSKMLYPKDTSHHADDKEIINCRCVCLYS